MTVKEAGTEVGCGIAAGLAILGVLLCIGACNISISIEALAAAISGSSEQAEGGLDDD